MNASTTFNRDSTARWYAKQHLKTDPGVQRIWYLPTDAPEREIRFVEINDLMAERVCERLVAIDFGVDTGAETEHRLLVVDVTPQQWQAVEDGSLPLPDGWSLEGAISYPKKT